jgi:hypothetical protein
LEGGLLGQNESRERKSFLGHEAKLLLRIFVEMPFRLGAKEFLKQNSYFSEMKRSNPNAGPNGASDALLFKLV